MLTLMITVVQSAVQSATLIKESDMSNRNHIPCRVCGRSHKNPASSSICPDCGAAERLANKIKKERVEQQQEMDDQALNDSAQDMYRALRDVSDELPARPDPLGYTITLTQAEVDAIRAALAKADGELL